MIERILKLSELASRVARYRADRRRADELEALLRSSPRRLLMSHGFARSAEGFETQLAGSEEIPLELDLPARVVGWELPDGNYRLEITLSRAGYIDVLSGDGRTLVEGKRVLGSAVLDISSGSVRVRAGVPIESLRLTRYKRRTSGVLELGPLEADGLVTGRAIGFGSFRVLLAYDEQDGYSYSTELLRTGLIKAPVWKESLRVGMEALSYEDREGPARVTEDTIVWWGIRKAMPILEDPLLGGERWAYLWGRITEGTVLRSLSAVTGTPDDPTQDGFHLIEVGDELPSYEGVLAARGEPLRARDDILAHNDSVVYVEQDGVRLLPAGPLRIVRCRTHPRRFVVRVEGSGILRAIELEVRSNAHRPDLREEVEVRRYALNDFELPYAPFTAARQRSGSSGDLVYPAGLAERARHGS